MGAKQLIEISEKIFFQVMIEYEDCEATREIPEDDRSLESVPIENWPKAEKIAQATMEDIQTQFPNHNIVSLPLDQTEDGYHLLLVDDTGIRVAKVGVTITDYSEETIH